MLYFHASFLRILLESPVIDRGALISKGLQGQINYASGYTALASENNFV